MKTLLTVGGSIIACLVVLLVILRFTGFEPEDCYNSSARWTCNVSGLWLRGTLVTLPVTDWSFTDPYPHVKIQARTWYLLPHSVTTNFLIYNGQLYIQSTNVGGAKPNDRFWHKLVARDPHVRLKIGNQLFDRTLLLITDPAEIAGVIQAKANRYPAGKGPEWSPWRAATVETSTVFRVVPN